MSTYTDIEYIEKLKFQLLLFKKTGRNHYNFRCPICGDSTKSKTKARGYIYEKHSKINFRCFNCGASMGASNFIKHVNPELHKEYIAESFEDTYKHQRSPKFAKNAFQNKPTTPLVEKVDVLENLEPISTFKKDHIAYEYLQDRGIPVERYDDLYYVNDINKISIRLPKYKDKILNSTPRIMIPFRNEDGIITHIQGRAIAKVDKTQRFITLEVQKDATKIYGMDKIDRTKPILIVEGSFDAMFLSNAVAMGGSDINLRMFDKKKDIFIFDNEDNPEIIKRMEKLIKAGYRVCIWDYTIPFILNDINDMMIHFETQENLEEYITNHSFQGLEAEMEMITYIKRKL